MSYFNLIFVIVFHLGVAGVAISTMLCLNVFLLVLVLRCLIHADGVLNLSKDQLRFHKDKLIKMLQIGFTCRITGNGF